MKNTTQYKEVHESINKSNRRIFLLMIGLLVILFFSSIVAINFGTADLNISDIFKLVVYQTFGLEIGNAAELSQGFLYDIVWLIRVPRIILAAIIGSALALVGVVMQAVVKNPLANPYILGISSGASLGATLAILIGFGSLLGGNSVGIAAFIGALLSSFLVYYISNIGGRITSVKLLLAGMAVSSLMGAFSSFIVYMADDAEGIRSITFWLMGSLTGAKWEDLPFISIVVIGSVVFFMTQFRNLNMLLMGDEAAISLGTDLNGFRKIYLVLTSLIIGLAVCFSGTIGFVGLIIPHIVRIFVGTDHKKLVPISALVGAIFLVWADVVARGLLNGAELPIGIITSMIGAPIFIWLMVTKTYGFGKSSS